MNCLASRTGSGAKRCARVPSRESGKRRIRGSRPLAEAGERIDGQSLNDDLRIGQSLDQRGHGTAGGRAIILYHSHCRVSHLAAAIAHRSDGYWEDDGRPFFDATERAKSGSTYGGIGIARAREQLRHGIMRAGTEGGERRRCSGSDDCAGIVERSDQLRPSRAGRSADAC